jgi:LacI family transcriptional regulator
VILAAAVNFSPYRGYPWNILRSAIKVVRISFMVKRNQGDRFVGGTNGDKGRLRILVRLWEWSEWCRQVFRGVQGFAQSCPDWQLHVVTGLQDISGNLGKIEWDGILTHVLWNHKAIRRVWRAGRTKIVSFTAAPPSALREMPSARVNDSVVARAIGQHLLSAGFRKFAYHAQERPYPVQDFRRDAVLEFAKSVGCSCTVSGSALSGSGAAPRVLQRWVARLDKPVGIFAWSMPVAIRIIQACADGDVAVPDEVAVVSWDDDPLLAQSIVPNVSAAVIPAERLGHEAAALLDRLLRGEPTPKEPVIVEPSGVLHVRQSSDVSSLANRDVYLAIQYIRERAGRPLGVKELVEEMHISRSKLERDFHRVTGRTLNQEIVAAHLERAKQLLVETHWPLDRLAKNAGFGTKQHFHRTFARSEGITPTEYRRRFGAV